LSKKRGKGPKSAAVKNAAAASAGKPGVPKSQAAAQKATAKALGKLKALQSAAEAKKVADPSAAKRKIPLKEILIIGGGACALVVLVLLIFFSPASREAPPQTAAKPPRLSGDDRKDFPAIRTIRFEPPQPTRTDTLKAEILADARDPGRLTYAYVWKVNDRIIEDAEGDTLDLSALELKKRDLITVNVTPYDGARAGFPVESPVVAVQSIPPTLNLEMLHQTRKAAETLEMQLVSRHPDSDSVTFSLEAPTVPGMSMDPNSGKITWNIQPDQQGTIRFGAAVEDTEQTKVTRIFNITIEQSTVASAPAGAGPDARSQPVR